MSCEHEAQDMVLKSQNQGGSSGFLAFKWPWEEVPDSTVSAHLRESTAETESCYLSCICGIISLRLSCWLLSLNTRIPILHSINRKCLLNNFCNALYIWVSLTSQGTAPDFPCNKEQGFFWSFPDEIQKRLSVSGTQRGDTWGLEILKYVLPGVGVRKVEEEGMPITHIFSLETWDTELQSTVMWSPLVPTSIQHLLVRECFSRDTSGHLQQQCSLSPWLIAPRC